MSIINYYYSLNIAVAFSLSSDLRIRNVGFSQIKKFFNNFLFVLGNIIKYYHILSHICILSNVDSVNINIYYNLH